MRTLIVVRAGLRSRVHFLHPTDSPIALLSLSVRQQNVSQSQARNQEEGYLPPPKFSKHSTEILTYAETFKE